MIDITKRQTLYVWIAMLALLFGALAPTVSHALAALDGSAGMVEICTVDGYKLVKVATSDGSNKPLSTNHGMEHCALCTIPGDSLALAGAPAAILALDFGHDAYPPLFYTAPHSLHTWSAANPRAPPILA